MANYYFFTYLIQQFLGSSFIVSIFGRWSEVENGTSYLQGGFGYFLSPPRNTWELITDPIHTAFYTAYVLFTFVYICRIWVDVNGSSARDVARQLAENDMTIEGYRDGPAVIKYLNRYILQATQMGGVAIGGLSIAANIIGALGSGTGTVLGVTIVYQYFEMLAKERQQYGEGFAM